MARREHPPQLALDNQLCFALYRASRAVQGTYAPFLADLGLTYPQYLTMLVLWESEGPLSVGEIGARLHLDSGTLTPLLKRLEEHGWVERRRDSADERRVHVVLTRTGRALRHRAEHVPGEVFGCYDLTVEEAVALRDTLNALSEQIDSLAG